MKWEVLNMYSIIVQISIILNESQPVVFRCHKKLLIRQYNLFYRIQIYTENDQYGFEMKENYVGNIVSLCKVLNQFLDSYEHEILKIFWIYAYCDHCMWYFQKYLKMFCYNVKNILSLWLQMYTSTFPTM